MKLIVVTILVTLSASYAMIPPNWIIPQPTPIPCMCAPGPPICGSNFQTYSGVCDMNCETREIYPPVYKIWDGPCDIGPPSPLPPPPPSPYWIIPQPTPIPCMCAPEPPICGSNFQTYSGVCDMNCETRDIYPPVYKIWDGPCDVEPPIPFPPPPPYCQPCPYSPPLFGSRH